MMTLTLFSFVAVLFSFWCFGVAAGWLLGRLWHKPQQETDERKGDPNA